MHRIAPLLIRYYPLSNGGALVLPFARTATPSGRLISPGLAADEDQALLSTPARTESSRNAHDDARDEARSSTRPRAAPKLLRPSVRLLLIEPEGVLKKQCNVSVVDDAQAAQSKRRRSLYGAARHDAFFMPETLRAEIVTNREAGTYQGDPNDPRMVELQGVQIRQVRAW